MARYFFKIVELLLTLHNFQYDFMHVTPPMGPPKALLNAKSLTNAGGFVEVNKSTMQHVKFPNVFALGDCADSPNSKTAAAAGIYHYID